MKRIFSIFVVFVILVFMAIPAMAADLQGGYYFVADSALGDNLKFYVPADFANGSLTYDSSGFLFNLTSSSIYLYCPDYPDYTIYASRFSGFQYRAGSGAGYSYIDLNISNISDTNLEIFEKYPGKVPRVPELLLVIVVLLVVLIGCYLIVRR